MTNFEHYPPEVEEGFKNLGEQLKTQHLRGEIWKAEQKERVDQEAALRAKVFHYSALFTEMCQTRHAYGQQKYSEFTFLDAPTISMAMEEASDLANYAKYIFIRLGLLSEMIERAQSIDTSKVDGAFIPTGDTLGVVKEDM